LRKCKTGQMLRRDPLNGLRLPSPDHTRKLLDLPGIKKHGAIAVCVTNLQQGLCTQHLDTYLLVQFAAQGLIDAFPRFYFSARKLPQPSLMEMIMTSGDQDFAGAVANDPNGDVERTGLRGYQP
ncbi:MAG: hypothetical protein H6R26_1559, partial [Proteobacteria bacterium]|nr:hypothetical protein [Pseudomonadota bacterium]